MGAGDDAEQGSEFGEGEKAAPEGGGTRVAIGLATDEAAEPGDPADSLVDGWGSLGGVGVLRERQARACHSAVERRIVQGRSGSVLARREARRTRQATTLATAIQRCRRRAVSSWRSSILQPLLRMACQSSISQRQQYQSTSWLACRAVVTGRVVSNIHSMGSASAGGAVSMTQTAVTLVGARCSAVR
jgi:hypothetical protein